MDTEKLDVLIQTRTPYSGVIKWKVRNEKDGDKLYGVCIAIEVSGEIRPGRDDGTIEEKSRIDEGIALETRSRFINIPPPLSPSSYARL